MPSSVTVPVYYIRHGQSQWNALQTAERATGRAPPAAWAAAGPTSSMGPEKPSSNAAL